MALLGKVLRKLLPSDAVAGSSPPVIPSAPLCPSAEERSVSCPTHKKRKSPVWTQGTELLFNPWGPFFHSLLGASPFLLTSVAHLSAPQVASALDLMPMRPTPLGMDIGDRQSNR